MTRRPPWLTIVYTLAIKGRRSLQSSYFRPQKTSQPKGTTIIQLRSPQSSAPFVCLPYSYICHALNLGAKLIYAIRHLKIGSWQLSSLLYSNSPISRSRETSVRLVIDWNTSVQLATTPTTELTLPPHLNIGHSRAQQDTAPESVSYI